jgi:hypothetical protein
MTVVALSASYGAAGGLVGTALADRLDVPFLDRAIPMAVATRLRVPFDYVDAHDDTGSVGRLERLLSGFLGTDAGGLAPLPAGLMTSADFRRATEEVVLRHAEAGEGVILGRAAVVVLRGRPGVLSVRLDGPPARRLDQAMRLQRIDEDTARRAMRRLDRAHAAYFRQYGVRPTDPSLYHLMIDSTVLELDTCVDLIVDAATAAVAS